MTFLRITTRVESIGYWVICAVLFLLVALRAFTVPFAHDEASTFFFYVQSDDFLPFVSFIYTNNHFLNSLFSDLFYHLGGSHRFILRLPNILAFPVLCWGVYRFLKSLDSFPAKAVLMGFFLFNLNFLELFEMCRGYGISMAFFVLALSFLQSYFSENKFKYVLLFGLFIQLAVSANLTLLVIAAFLFLFQIIVQYKRQVLFQRQNLLYLFLNFIVYSFWFLLSIYYKNSGVLDSGASENYWQTSFVSLMEFLLGSKALYLQRILVGVFIGVSVYLLLNFLKRGKRLKELVAPQFFYWFLFLTLVITYYILNKAAGINYPEDRTGLFFYVLFALGLSFLINSWAKNSGWVLALPFVSYFVLYSLITFNLSTFHYYFYQVFPKEFYSVLRAEQSKSREVLTIGGNASREMIYAFMNYRGGGELNPMDANTEMQMNSDYCIASRLEFPYYKPYYEELIYDKYWNRVLLKRKEKIQRQIIYGKKDVPAYYSSKDEFCELFRLNNVELDSLNSLEAEIEIFFKKVPAPFHSFLVFSLDHSTGPNLYYERILLNWLGDDLSGIRRTFKMSMKKAPPGKQNLVVYLWNIDKKDFQIVVPGLKINELHGKGVNVEVPSMYYPIIEKITKSHLL